MQRPVIGVIACNRAAGEDIAASVMHRYITAAIAHADVAALLVPSLPDHMTIAEVLPRVDGIMLTGSISNVGPGRYGDDSPDPPGPFDAARDAMALGLVDAALLAGKPVLGVCRGFQEINVAFGGTLRRDLGDRAPLPHHAPDGSSFTEMFEHRHAVALAPGGVLATAFGRETLTVNSVHYQGIDRLGAGLAVEATAPDGVIEAVSARRHGTPLLAVQWHPEWDAADPDSARIFQMFGAMLRG